MSQPALRRGVGRVRRQTSWGDTLRSVGQTCGVPRSAAAAGRPDKESVAVRLAGTDDTAAVVAIDHAAFPSTDGSVQAQPNELERAVEKGEVIVAVDNGGSIVGYLHAHPVIGQDYGYVAGLAVLPERQGRGVGDALFNHARRSSNSRSVWYATVRPDNVPMLKLLTRHGFFGTRFLPDFYGAGRDRLLVAADRETAPICSDELELVPVGNLAHVRNLLNRDEWILRALVKLSNGDFFEFRRRAGDRGAQLANETAVSVAFGGTILAASTFLLGFGISAGNSIPADILAQLTAGVIASIVALTIYANATGELARRAPRSSVRYLRVGNVLSEFGGVLLLLQILPVALSVAKLSDLGGLVACVLGAGALWAYLNSPFDILGRYPLGPSVVRRFVRLALAMSPILGLAAFHYLGELGGTVGWSALNILALTMVAFWCLRSDGETGAGHP